MAQHDYDIANQSFPSFRSDLNSVLEAINTSNSGTSRPSSAVAGTIWLDSTNATSPTLKFFDGSDDISLATLDYTANTVNWLDSTVSVDIVGDTTPQLGGNLDVNGNSIVSVANGNITITPDGTGKLVVSGLSYPTSDGTTGQFLKTDGSGNLSFDTVTTAGTVLTTQGDIVYRDASGLARLGAGTSGQVLQTNGTGANPTWVDASGGIYENLLNGSVSSAVSQVSFDNVFSSTYEHYRILLNDFSFASDCQAWMRFRQSGSNVTSSDYMWSVGRPYVDSAGNTGVSNGGGWSNGYFSLTGDAAGMSSDNDFGIQAIVDIYHPSQTKITFYKFRTASYETGRFNLCTGGGFLNTNGSYDGIAVLSNNGANVDKGNYAVFGVKHS